MARCSCGQSVCACRMGDGQGTTVEGSGTSDSPFRVNVTGDISHVLQVIDTTTVDLSLGGQGTSAEPFQLKADVIARLADLADVSHTDVPVNGEVPMWVTDHWEFQPVPPAAPGIITASGGVMGDGSGGNPLRANVPYIWGQGEAAGWPSDSTLGRPAYIDSNNQIRTRPYSFMHVGSDPPGRKLFTPDSGWSIGSTLWGRWGPICYCSAGFTRTGNNISTGASGDLSGYNVGFMDPAFPRPVSSLATVFSVNATGPMIGLTMGIDGTIGLAATIPNWTIATNQVFTFRGFYLTATGMEGVSLADGTIGAKA